MAATAVITLCLLSVLCFVLAGVQAVYMIKEVNEAQENDEHLGI